MQNVKIFTIKVHANAKKNEVLTSKNDCVDYAVNTTATPENGKANEAIVELLSKHFKVGKSKITIQKGLTSKIKTIQIVFD